MVVLDNGATVTSGFQPNPGVGRDARGRPSPALSIARIAAACGVEFVRDVGPDARGPALRERFREALAHRGLGLLVVRTPCDPPVEVRRRPAPRRDPIAARGVSRNGTGNPRKPLRSRSKSGFPVGDPLGCAGESRVHDLRLVSGWAYPICQRARSRLTPHAGIRSFLPYGKETAHDTPTRLKRTSPTEKTTIQYSLTPARGLIWGSSGSSRHASSRHPGHDDLEPILRPGSSYPSPSPFSSSRVPRSGTLRR